MLKILYICHRFPYPPKRGGKIRPFNMIRHLHNQGHQVTVASLARAAEEEGEAQGIRDFCHEFFVARVGRFGAVLRMILNLPSFRPSTMGYFYSAELARYVEKILRQQRQDLIFVHCSSVAQYASHVNGPKKILDFGDMDSQKWLIYSRFRSFPLSMGYFLEGKKMERAEKKLAAAFDLNTCTTRAELETLQGFQAGTQTGWFPNGVDLEYFSPGGVDYEPDTICFVGRMDYFPNQDAMFFFCDRVLPIIQRVRPNIMLLIVGASPSKKVLKLGQQDGVTVTGSVEDVRPFVKRAALTVAPLRIARGTQNKILESMAMGIPVVSSMVAAQGVDAVPGEHLITADSPDDYARAVTDLLEQPELRDRFSRAARARVESHHTWSSSMTRLDALIEGCVTS